MNSRIHLFLLAGLAGCVLVMPATHVSGQTLVVLHYFAALSGPNATNCDGANPSGGLFLSGPTLYGTANYGGSSGWGTLFAINTNGSGFTTTYNFTGGNDGANPIAGVVVSNNTLYGTASGGGSAGTGTAFAVGTDGTGFAILHSFTAPVSDSHGLLTNSDGACPLAGLLLSGGILYGAANDGGTAGRGTLFAVGANGMGFRTVHSFSSGTGGGTSSAGLIFVGSTLYGVNYANLGNGTVFAVYTDGTGFTNHYAFTPGHPNGSGVLTNSDGSNPHAKLLLSGNTLYGTASAGGRWGNGTVFAISTDGTVFSTLHSFAPYNSLGPFTNSDGANPATELILSGNTLYGTARAGGISGNGTIFSINTDGTGFTNLYNFTATPPYPQTPINCDGASPSGGLILSGNTLYGMTSSGGSSGNGTVFSLSLGASGAVRPALAIISVGTSIVLNWPANAAACTLQSASTPAGVFTNIPGATSPYTNPIYASQQFFRLSR